MDTDALVNEQKEDGQKLLDYLAGSGFEVQAAFWVMAAEDGRWHYYLVSPAVDTDGLAQAYRRLHPLVRRGPQPSSIDPLGVKLIGPSNPMAQDVFAIHRRSPEPRVCPLNWGGILLGLVSVEGAYLYPLPAGVAV